MIEPGIEIIKKKILNNIAEHMKGQEANMQILFSNHFMQKQLKWVFSNHLMQEKQLNWSVSVKFETTSGYLIWIFKTITEIKAYWIDRDVIY